MLIPFLPIRFRKAMKSASQEIRKRAGKELTELLGKSIMILEREKENGVLTEWARNDIAEFLSCACDHLYGNDSELIREVHEVMEPAIKLRREIAQENMELRKSNENLEKSNKDLEERNKKFEDGLIILIQKSQHEGKNKDEVMKTLQEIFSLSEAEAKEKVEKHWKS